MFFSLKINKTMQKILSINMCLNEYIYFFNEELTLGTDEKIPNCQRGNSKSKFRLNDETEN